MATWNPDLVSKKAFRELLEQARVKAGSVANLGAELKVNPRRIARWLAGQGPAYPVMSQVYVTLYRYVHRE